MPLPDEPDGQRPPYLSDAWEWNDTSEAWEQVIGSYRLVCNHDIICVYEIDDPTYEFSFHTTVYDAKGDGPDKDEDNYSQKDINEFYGLDNIGQIEGGYDNTTDYNLAEDLAGIREDILDNWKCECGNDVFYVIASLRDPDNTQSGYSRVYGCTAVGCAKVYTEDEVPEGTPIAITNIHYLDE